MPGANSCTRHALRPPPEAARISTSIGRDPLGVGAPWSSRHAAGPSLGRSSWSGSRWIAAARIVVGGGLAVLLLRWLMLAWTG